MLSQSTKGPQVHTESVHTSSRGSARARGVAANLILLMAGLTAYLRLFLGVDLTDEAFYSSVPYSFALGFVPYHDELGISQNSGILLYPFYRLYLWVCGSSEGLILFNRHLFFLTVACAALLAHRAGRRLVDASTGSLLAAFVFGYSHFNIPSLSYNTVGSLALLIGCGLLLGAAAAPPPAGQLPAAAGGACGCFVISTFGYPSLLPAAIAGFAGTWWLAADRSPRKWCRARTAIVVVGTLAVAAALLFVLLATPRAIGEALEYVASFGHSPSNIADRFGTPTLRQLRLIAYSGTGFFAAACLWLAMIARSQVQRSRIGMLLPALLLLCYLPALYQARLPYRFPHPSAPMVMMFALCLPLALILLQDRWVARRILIVAGIPAYAAAVCVSGSSTNGLFASTLGLFPAALSFLLVVAVMVHQRSTGHGVEDRRCWWWHSFMYVVIGFQAYGLLSYSYRDEPFGDGTPVWAQGPYAGILTGKARADQVAQLNRALAQVSGPGRTLFALESIPAAFLFSTLRPATFSTWVLWSPDEAVNQKYLQRVFGAGKQWPDVILRTPDAPPLTRLGIIEGQYVRLPSSSAAEYELYLKTGLEAPAAPSESPTESAAPHP